MQWHEYNNLQEQVRCQIGSETCKSPTVVLTCSVKSLGSGSSDGQSHAEIVLKQFIHKINDKTTTLQKHLHTDTKMYSTLQISFSVFILANIFG